MIESINITWLMPDHVSIKVWDNVYDAYVEHWKYILDVVLSNYLETDCVFIYVNGILFDSIEKRIALRAGDTLHLEYSIYVGE